MSFLHFLHTHCSEKQFATDEHLNPALIRMSIFCITAVCGSLPAVVWALHVLYHHHRSGGRISAISIFLLLSDLLELVLSLVILAFMLGNLYIINCNVVFGLLFEARICGHHFHQLMALESIISLRYPSLAHIFSLYCSTVLCIIDCADVSRCCWMGSKYVFVPVACSCVGNHMLTYLQCFFSCSALKQGTRCLGTMCCQVYTYFFIFAIFVDGGFQTSIWFRLFGEFASDLGASPVCARLQGESLVPESRNMVLHKLADVCNYGGKSR